MMILEPNLYVKNGSHTLGPIIILLLKLDSQIKRKKREKQIEPVKK
jgi:hypothetical protein